jgi:hypothetical protein
MSVIIKLKTNRLKLLLALSISLLFSCDSGAETMFFKGNDAVLEAAINQDNAEAVKKAIQQGANINAVGLHGVTPVIVTSGNLKFNAMKALIDSGANPNTYDKNGDNAVTLAATSYRNGDKRYLEYLLDHGGDPSSKLPDGDPVLTRIALSHDLVAIRWIIKKGADINAVSRDGDPLIFDHASSIDWDTAWVLMESGANYKFADPRFSWFELLSLPRVVPPGSPLFQYKEKVWRKLCENGIKVPPLTTRELWKEEYYPKDLPAPADKMPIITCDNVNHKVKGEWGKLKPAVKSAYQGLKEQGRL